MTTAKDILIAARALLAKRGGWTQGAFARDKKGQAVPGHLLDNSVPIKCYCADGALLKVGGEPSSRRKAQQALLDVIHGYSIWDWNDRVGRRKKAILAGFDRAIASLD